jgi:hypothetical protein
MDWGILGYFAGFAAATSKLKMKPVKVMRSEN